MKNNYGVMLEDLVVCVQNIRALQDQFAEKKMPVRIACGKFLSKKIFRDFIRYILYQL